MKQVIGTSDHFITQHPAWHSYNPDTFFSSVRRPFSMASIKDAPH
jgi:hypothetical protein